MFIKFIMLVILINFSFGEIEIHDWDLAVVINDQIDLMLSNGTQIGSAYEQFSKLKALTFDNVRHQFIVSDMDQQNDTIFTVPLTKKTDITPIIEDLPDDVQGLAIDPITDILYWTDSINKTINYVSLKNSSAYNSQILFSFEEENPQDITIDVCRRYIYWTNSNVNKPSIERSLIGSNKREILIDSDLYKPAGIAIDYHSKRLVWADMEGIYYSIESSNFDGKEREIVFAGTHSKPFGVAVDMNAIYWTDINNNALWNIQKNERDPVPQRLRDFNEKPMGIVAKNVQIRSTPDCRNLEEEIDKYTESTIEVFKLSENDKELEEDRPVVCLNGGELVDNNRCKCQRGFVGEFCELSVCHNFCLHGKCVLSSLGYPQCGCLRGFSGARCEKNKCDGFCLNDGTCTHDGAAAAPQCACVVGFSGRRCELQSDFCASYCKELDKSGELLTNSGEQLCRCNEDGAYNMTAMSLLAKEDRPFFEHFRDREFIIMACLIFILLILTIALSIYACSSRRRPRIKKRIIVNKNVTPLTYRPQPTTEQCEITIENCCNMNICETPCFEPPQLACMQHKNDDRKKLLSNMENGEDLY